ncbi:tyrosine-protein phosphatase non-receptor type 13-like [Centruroides vittatus]|uniref:tyrosine-protein phosphatase non-receptor type 13-like n=1 Tax=Centruroides vittatus TaxID=120091 RepID=UPI00350EAE3D
MPVLENVHVTLLEILEVRGSSLTEAELWSVLHHTVEAIQDLFLKGCAHKDGIPQQLVTLNSLQCTAMGRVLLSSCSIQNVQGTPYWCNDMQNVGAAATDLDIEMMYVYTLGQTLHLATEYVQQESRLSYYSNLSSVLISTIQAMKHSNINLRMKLSDIMEMCYIHGVNIIGEKSFSNYIVQLHREVLGSIPEHDILNQVEKDINMENELMSQSSPPDDEFVPESRRPSIEYIDKSVIYGHRLGYNPVSSLTMLVTSPEEKINPKERWKRAVRKIISKRKCEKFLTDNDIPSEWKEHKAKDSILRVYEELTERRKMLELLRMSINIGSSLPVSQDTALTKGLKPKTLAELVMLLQCPKKQSSLLRSSSRGTKAKSATINSSSASLRNDMTLDSLSEEESNTKKFKRHHRIENIVKTPLYSLDQVVSKKTDSHQNNSIKKKILGPEFVVMSVKPVISLSLDTKTKKSTVNKSKIFPCRVTVILLNGIHLDISCNSSVVVKDIYNIASAHLSLPENSVFGLAFKHDGDVFFLENQEKLVKQILRCWMSNPYSKKAIDEDISFTLYWRVKFYLKDINLIRHSGVRHQYYLQFRRDLLEERIYCDDNEAMNLAGFALQAEFGNFDKVVHKNYFLLEHYLPQRIIHEMDRSEAKEKLTELHGIHYGLSKEISELEFMQGVQKLPEYGYHFYKVIQDKKHLSSYIWIGIFEEGIDIFEEKGNKRNKIQEYPWKEIYRISYTNHYFSLCPRTESITGWHIHFKFYVTHNIKSKCFFNLAMSHHQFYVKLKSRVKASEIFCEDYETDAATNESSDIADTEASLETGYDFQLDSQQQQVLSWQQFTKGAKYLGSLVNLRSTPRRSSNKKKGKKPVSIKPLVLTKYQKEVISGMVDPTKPIIKSASAPDSILNEDFENEQDIFGQLKYEFKTECSGCCSDKESRTVRLIKDEKLGLGITITCGNTLDSILCGALVESIKPNGPAYKEGSLKIGDHIISVNGEFVQNAHYLDVVDMIQNSPPTVELTVRSHYENILISDDKQTLNESQSLDIKLKEPSWDEYQDVVNKSTFSNSHNGQSSKSDPPIPKPRKKWSEKCKVSESNYTSNDSKYSDADRVDTIAKSIAQVHKIATKNLLNNELGQKSQEESSKEICDNEIDSDLQNNNQYHDTKEIEDENNHLNKIEMLPSGNIISLDLKKMEENLDLEAKDTSVPGLISVRSLLSEECTEPDERIQPGDQILDVNGVQFNNVPYYETVDLLRTSPKVINVLVEKTLENEEENSRSELHIDDDDCDELDRFYDGNMKKWQVTRSSKDRLTKSSSCEILSRTTNLHSTRETSQEKSDASSDHRTDGTDLFDRMQGTIPMPVLNCDKMCIEDDQVSCDTSSGISTGSSSLFPCIQEEKIDSSNTYRVSIEKCTLPLVTKNDIPLLDRNRDYFNKENNLLNNTTVKSYSLPDSNRNTPVTITEAIQNGGYLSKVYDLDLTIAPKVPQRRFRQLRKVEDIYKFITKENTFDVHIRKSSRGLGLSICGGRDTGGRGCINQLIRIRKLYPLQPAMECGKLRVGDVIIEVNGKSTLNLTHTEALDALRAAPINVTLKIHRPDPTIIPSLPLNMRDDSCPSFSLESPSSSVHNTLSRSSSINNHSAKEFEIVIEKHEGSLGFTVLKREQCESTYPGLFVKDLIREPAKSDGRIQPGDQILQVNDTDMSELSHAEAISFLRSAPNEVKLKLSRHVDPPLSPLSGDDEPPLSKPLRREAVELLNDWARQKENDSPGKKRERRRVRTKVDDSFSSSGSRSNSSSVSQDNTFLISDSDNVLSEEELSNDSPGLKRNLRPKSLDILSSFTRKQRLANFTSAEDQSTSFRRQTSVKVTNLDAQTSMFPSNEDEGNTKKNLLKWRGTVLPKTGSESENELNLGTLDEKREDTTRQISEDAVQFIEVQLDRGWHGRLGFSISDPLTENILPNGPEVKIVHEGSLASRDGRIKAGDRLVQVNGEMVTEKPASEIIDILRKTRGLVNMIFARLIKSTNTENAT